MAADSWTNLRLGDACTKIGSGATPRGGGEVYVKDGPYALIRSQNVYNDGFHCDGLAFIEEQHASELKNVEVQSGDVLLNISGDSVARCCVVDDSILPARVNQHVAIIRTDPKKLNARFLRYVLISPTMQQTMLSWAGAGGTRDALTKLMIQSFEVLAPQSITEQTLIGNILGTLDDKIELNRRMNDTLEAIARALFKSWFVNFDPVHAKAEDRNTGLPKEIADLFPDSFVDSELGKIPRGWSISKIGKLATVSGGSTPSTKEPTFWEPGTHYWATPKDLSNLKSPVLLRTDRKISASGLTQISSALLPRGTVLLSSRAPIGYLVVAEVPVAINQGFIAMLAAEGVSNLFVLRWVEWAHDLILSRANGSTFLEISKSSFRSIPIVCPTKNLFRAFDQLARPLYSRLVSNEKESRVLADIRVTLLPKLMSGEIRA